MNSKRKIFKKVLITIFALGIVSILSIHLAPVDFDASPCSGGFKKYIISSNLDQLIDIYRSSNNLTDSQSISIESTTKDMVNSVHWNKRQIYVRISIRVNNKNEDVSFVGKRYWTNKYKWSIITS